MQCTVIFEEDKGNTS